MASLHILTAAEQVAEHLRQELATGTWRGEMPGVAVLATELGVNHKTVNAALALLERDGLLVNQGARRPRRVLSSAASLGSPSLRIGLLLHEKGNHQLDYVMEIRHRLLEKGHAPFFATSTLSDLGMDAGRVACLVERTPADGWLVMAGSREVLEWFAAGPLPAFALFGVLRSVAIAGTGPDKTPAYVEAARTLVALGHRRIVLLARPQRRLPVPGNTERFFLEALREAGIEPGDYHFPAWEDTKDDFHRCLDSLFRVSPPTALVVQEAVLFAAVQQFLAARGIRVPQDVSLVCDDPDPTFVWQIPTVAHIQWKSDPWARRVTRWADNIACGKDDRRHTLTKARFVSGGTVGPASERGGSGS